MTMAREIIWEHEPEEVTAARRAAEDDAAGMAVELGQDYARQAGDSAAEDASHDYAAAHPADLVPDFSGLLEVLSEGVDEIVFPPHGQVPAMPGMRLVEPGMRRLERLFGEDGDNEDQRSPSRWRADRGMSF